MYVIKHKKLIKLEWEINISIISVKVSYSTHNNW